MSAGSGLLPPDPGAESIDAVLPPVVQNDLVTITPVLLLPKQHATASENGDQTPAKKTSPKKGSSEAERTSEGLPQEGSANRCHTPYAPAVIRRTSFIL